jgi:hypothetical protein
MRPAGVGRLAGAAASTTVGGRTGSGYVRALATPRHQGNPLFGHLRLAINVVLLKNSMACCASSYGKVPLVSGLQCRRPVERMTGTPQKDHE